MYSRDYFDGSVFVPCEIRADIYRSQIKMCTFSDKCHLRIPFKAEDCE